MSDLTLYCLTQYWIWTKLQVLLNDMNIKTNDMYVPKAKRP